MTATRFDIRALATVITNEQAHLDDVTAKRLHALATAGLADTAEEASAAYTDADDLAGDVRRAEARIRHYRLAWGALTGVHGEDADSDIAAIAATTGYVAHYSDLT